MRRVDVISIGEALVDFLPLAPGPLASVPAFERHAGGAPANVAIGVARLGRRASFVGVVGDDPFGAFLCEALAREGVGVEHLARSAGVRTGLAFVSLDADGKPRFFAAGGSAELGLSLRTLEGVAFEDAWILHVSSGLVRSPGAREATFEAVDRARRAGCLVAFDPNLRLHHWSDPAPLARDVATLVDQASIVKLSSDEISFVAGTSEPAIAARRLVERGPRIAVVTCGADGCVWARRVGGAIAEGQRAARPARVVDTTGAGDGFQAALLAGLSRALGSGEDALALPRASWDRVLARASETGTRVCEAMGAVAGLATAADLATFEP